METVNMKHTHTHTLVNLLCFFCWTLLLLLHPPWGKLLPLKLLPIKKAREATGWSRCSSELICCLHLPPAQPGYPIQQSGFVPSSTDLATGLRLTTAPDLPVTHGYLGQQPALVSTFNQFI